MIATARAGDGGAPFTRPGAVHSEIAAVGKLEAQWRLPPNITFGTIWDGIFGNKGQDPTITGRFKVAF